MSRAPFLRFSVPPICRSFLLIAALSLSAQLAHAQEEQRTRPLEDLAYSCEGTEKTKFHARIYLADGTFYEEVRDKKTNAKIGALIGKWKHAPRGSWPWVEYAEMFQDDGQRWIPVNLRPTYNALSGNGILVRTGRAESTFYCESNTAERSEVVTANAKASVANLAAAVKRGNAQQAAQWRTAAEADQMQLQAIEAVAKAAGSKNAQCRVNSEIVEKHIHQQANVQERQSEVYIRQGLTPLPQIAHGSYLRYQHLASLLKGC